MKVFISWAGRKSLKIAEALRETLNDLFLEYIDFWVSAKDINPGGVFDAIIFESLQKCDMSIACLLAENRMRPWIYFEAGAVFACNYRVNNGNPVIPIVFDGTRTNRFAGTPFSQLQLIRFGKTKFLASLKEINRQYKEKHGSLVMPMTQLEKQFERFWPILEERINRIIQQKFGGEEMLTTDNIQELLTQYNGFSTPQCGDVIRYSSGFETTAFYQFLLENTSKRLYIFGRKNSKLADRSFDRMLGDLLADHEFDLKILFLNPSSKQTADGVAQDTRNFATLLKSSIDRWITRFSSYGLNVSNYCKLYSVKREFEAIIADDVVLYKEMVLSAEGKPVHFTDGPFYVTSIDSGIGNEHVKRFNDVWRNKSTPLVVSESE